MPFIVVENAKFISSGDYLKIVSIYTSYHPEIGGIQKSIKLLSENFIQLGHSAAVISLSSSRSLPDYEEINGVKVYRIYDPYYKYLKDYSLSFKNVWHKHRHLCEKSDIINIFGYNSLFAWQASSSIRDERFEGKLFFIPNYLGIGSTFINDILHKFYKIKGRTIFDVASGIICVSEYEHQKIMENFQINSNKICVIANGIDFEIYSKSIEKRINRKDLRLLYVGRLEKFKGVHYIIRSIPILKEKYSINAKLTIVGKGSYKKELANIIKSMNIEQNVSFAGPRTRNELKEYYSKSDILLLLSKFESYGLVVAEALASGLAVIVSDNTALREFTHIPGCSCLEYPPKKEKLSKLIFDLSQDTISIGPLDQKKIRSWNITAKDYISFYQNFLK
jgi:glycosyltransferase involved in cell wall biosynthesis